MGGNYWGDSSGANGYGDVGMGNMPLSGGLPPDRQGSLSLLQQNELMDILESEGMTDIDTYLNMGMTYSDHVMDQGLNWGGGR